MLGITLGVISITLWSILRCLDIEFKFLRRTPYPYYYNDNNEYLEIYH